MFNIEKNQNFEKLKNPPGDIIILYICIINGNHMMYGFWEIECDRQNFLSFWTVFALLPTCGARKSKFWIKKKKKKNKNFKKKKKKKKTPEDIIILYMCTINDNHLMHGSWDMECNGQNLMLFWAFFCPFTPVTTKKVKIL